MRTMTLAALAALSLPCAAMADGGAPLPVGLGGSYRRLADLMAPSLFVWGSHDRLVPPGFSRHVRQWLPGAEQVTIDCCGHVPQVERPEETNALLLDFFARAERITGAPLRRGTLAAGAEAA